MSIDSVSGNETPRGMPYAAPAPAPPHTPPPTHLSTPPPTHLPAPASAARHRRHRLPTHFFIGTLLLYALVLGTFLLNLTRLHHADPNWRTLVPFAAAISFYVASTLFLLILGRGHVSRWTVLVCVAVALVSTAALTIIVRAHLLIDQVPPDADLLRRLLSGTAALVQSAHFGGGGGTGAGTLAEAAEFAIGFTIEEAIKLAPVFLLIALKKIRSAHAAMLCGALAGLTFGTLEAISYGYLVYPLDGSPVTRYLTRFFIMSPLHGIWDALAGGLAFFLSGTWRSNSRRGPTLGSAAAAFSCAVVFHVTHNALQAIVGPIMQIVTVFALLAPLYLMARVARRRAAVAEGAPDGGQLVGDLHLLTFALAVGFLAMSLIFSWVMGAA